MNRYRELRFYDGQNDQEAVRLSMSDGLGGEYFMVLPRDKGRKWRERREEALGNIAEAIEQGCTPGEVRVA